MAQGDIVLLSDVTGGEGAISIPKTAGGEVAARPVVIINPLTGAVSIPSAAVTEDAVAAANPAGPQIMARRKDTLSAAEVSTDGDHIALNATSKGELYARNLALEALLPVSLGAKLASASLSITPGAYAYETVAASATNQAMGATGATGDYLSHVIIQPVTTAAGTVTILDNAVVFFTFTTGTLADLRPIIVPVGCNSVSGAWKITTGANVTAVGVGTFT